MGYIIPKNGYPAAIISKEKIESTVLKDVQTRLLEAWLNNTKEQREKELERRVANQMPGILNRFVARYTSAVEVRNQKKLEQAKRISRDRHQPPQKQDKIDKIQKTKHHGQTILASDKWDIESQVNQVRATQQIALTNEYKKTFNQLWLGRSSHKPQFPLVDLFRSQIQSFELEKVITQFVARHPWMTINDPIVYQFFVDLTSTYLLKNLKKPTVTSWTEVSEKSLQNCKFTWHSVDLLKDENCQNLIEGFPLSDVKPHYLERDAKHYLNLLTTQNKDFFKHALTRVDVFRLLANWYPRMMRVDETCTPSCTQIVPLHATELQYLKRQQWVTIKTLLINIATEKSPYWILAHKENQQWTCYLPAENVPENLVQDLVKYFPKGTSVTTKLIDHTKNLELNNIDNLDEYTQWHAVLLGRILPWCQRDVGNHETIDTYRQAVPLPLLLQSVLMDCLPDTSSGKSFKEKLLNAFGGRAPFTSMPASQLFHETQEVSHLLDGGACNLQGMQLTILKEIDPILEAFDKKLLNFSPDLKTLTSVAEQTTLPQLIHALTITYHFSVSGLVFNAPEILDEKPVQNNWQSGYNNEEQNRLKKLKEHNQIIMDLFEYDVNLKTIHPYNNQKKNNNIYFQYAMHCAARNRFLATVDAPCLVNAENNIANRKKLWEHTGELIVAFFQKNTINLDFLRNPQAFNPEWLGKYCDHEHYNGSELDPQQWAFLQIAQMGIRGLDALFNHLENNQVAKLWKPEDKATAWHLSCAFNLAGSLTGNDINSALPISLTRNATDYIQHLTKKIGNFDNKKLGCTHLFRQLSLILPEARSLADNDCLEALKKLIQTIDQRKQQYPDEVNEIALYNLDINNQYGSWALLEKLTQYAKETKLKVLIRLPVWDQEAHANPSHAKLKAKYHELQHQILENQRLHNQQVLPGNTKNIYESAKGRLKAEVIIEENLAQLTQPWDGEDVFYPLTAQTLGIQQQLEQQVEEVFEQEQEQEQAEKQEPEQEQAQPISSYDGDENQLITRHNINDDEICRKAWDALPEVIRRYSGIEGDDLSQLFSLWVGSQKNATHVVEKFERSAILKMMQYASQFRLGIAKDNLPSGFSLAYSRFKNGLILCYSDRQYREDLIAREKLRPNPFTIELRDPEPTAVFGSDFRQLQPFASSLSPEKSELRLQTLWKYLATEDTNEQRVVNAQECIRGMNSNTGDDPINAAVVMQGYYVFQSLVKPGELNDCLADLRVWAKRLKAPQELLTALFNSDQATVLTPQNLQAFGQLFNHYDTKEPLTRAQHTGCLLLYKFGIHLVESTLLLGKSAY